MHRGPTADSVQTETNAPFVSSNQWQPIAVARTIKGEDTTFLSLNIVNLSSVPKVDSFLFRDAEITLVDE